MSLSGVFPLFFVRLCALSCPSLYNSLFSGCTYVCTTAMFLVLSRCNDTGWYTTGRYSSAPFAYCYFGARIILFAFFYQDVYCSLRVTTGQISGK